MKFTYLIVFIFFSLFVFDNLAYSQNAQSDFVIKKHLQAIGGIPSWNKLHTLALEYQIVTEGANIKKNIYYLKDSCLRIQYDLKTRAQIQASNFQLVGKDTAVHTILEKDDVIIKPMNNKLSNDLLTDLPFLSPFLFTKERKIKTNYQGREYVLGINYHKFIVYYSSGKTEYVYLNPKTYLIEKIFLSSSLYEAYNIFEQYRKQKNNLVFPEHIETEKGIMLLKNIRINEDLPPNVFNPTFTERPFKTKE